MNRLTRLLIPAMLGTALLAPQGLAAQHRGAARSEQSPRTSHTSRPGNNTPRHQGDRKPAANRKRQQTDARPSARPVGNTAGTSPKPVGNQATRHKGQTGARHDRPERPNPGNNAGHNHASQHGTPGFRPGVTSAPRPGKVTREPRPHHDYRKPGYRPPRPGGGSWGAPPPCPWRIAYRVPPMPRRVRVVRAVPSIGTVLGLAFGSFIDAGINALYNAGYNVNGYYNDAIYLSNVRQLGYLWPEAIVRYNDGLMSGTQFYNWSSAPDQGIYHSLYSQLVDRYGTPAEVSYSGSGPSATWWGGGNTGYVTLSYGYGTSVSGIGSYYTSLTYTAC